MATQLQKVPFHGHTLFITQWNGQPYTPMKTIVENMGLAWQPQQRKLAANEDRWGVIKMVIPSIDPHNEVVCLPLRKLFGWLQSISLNKVRPELREGIRIYQNECDDVLFSYWTQGIAVNPRIKTKGQPKEGCLTLDQQDEIKAVVQARLEELPHNCRGKAALTCWSALKSKFGCHYKEIEDADYIEALSLVARLPLEDVKPLLGSHHRGNTLQIELTLDIRV